MYLHAGWLNRRATAISLGPLRLTYGLVHLSVPYISSIIENIMQTPKTTT